MPLSTTRNHCLVIFAIPCPAQDLAQSRHSINIWWLQHTLGTCLTVLGAPARGGPETGSGASWVMWPNSSTGLEIHTVLTLECRLRLEETGQQLFGGLAAGQ